MVSPVILLAVVVGGVVTVFWPFAFYLFAESA